ncbi:GGDEF domain-containing protein [Halomonas vilamensis]|uniref:diguanylate cyclase n=1 Tax=Vreelandella vilamensis TaxID=531309 RepID=A0ABU1H1L6_9GAMM|nr:GGDEF domain-containing protein [Halomonas vilamensis]MDR5898205.1 GGDEF domain-containing protein [Halomonas vilamensis]
MKLGAIKSIGWRLGLGVALLAGTCAIVVALYAFQARQYMGSNYTSLVADVVRPQLHTVMFRHALEDLRKRSTDPDVVSRLENFLWRVSQHIDGISFALQASRLSESDYHASLVRLQDVKMRLSEMRQQFDEVIAGASPEKFLHQGQMIENDLAMTYSALSDLVHSEAAKQRIVMERLGRTIAVLVFMILLLVVGLLISLFRLKREHHKVMQLSQRDELTKLGNRRYLMSFAESFCKQSQRSGRPLSLILMDIDHFKYVNDTFGHPAGDQILQIFAKALTDTAREVDVLARIGGEEFCVFMPDTDVDGAMKLAERLRQKVSDLTQQQLGVATSVTVSLGVATAYQNDAIFKHMYARADKALYQAKTHGRNRVEVG